MLGTNPNKYSKMLFLFEKHYKITIHKINTVSISHCT